MLFGNTSYDIAAILVLFVIYLWLLIEKRIPLKSYKVYFRLTLFVFASCCMELVTEHMAQYGYDHIAFRISLSFLVMALHPIPLMILWYIATLANTRIPRIYLVSVMLVIVGITASNPFTGCCIEYATTGYIFHWGSILLFAIDIFNVIFALFISLKLLKELKPARFITLWLGVFICWCGLLIQIIWHHHLMVYSMSITSLLLYQYLSNPSTMTDPATGLFNKKFMRICIQNQFLENNRFSIIMVSMDGFKFINKTYGVESGDELLQNVGIFLKSLTTQNDVFRIESDQFCILINNSNDLEKYTNQLSLRFKQTWNTSKHSDIFLSASICCISCPADAENYNELIDIMDYSLEIAKKDFKGQVCHATDLRLSNVFAQKDIENAIKLAIQKDGFMVYYQPIYSCKKKCYNSAEALVRLHTEELGWISPEIFIPIAEKNGYILYLGEIVLDKVCQFIRDSNLTASTIEYVEVNISTVQISQQNFAQNAIDILEKYGVAPQYINMEITETAAMSSQQIIMQNIEKLMAYGITFSLDDYGSGNANIDYINQIPFSIIKLDKSIVWNSFKDYKAQITLEYTIAMIKALQMHIVAEGVETEEMTQQLKNLGCDYFQGWYYSKAVPDYEFVKLINTFR